MRIEEYLISMNRMSSRDERCYRTKQFDLGVLLFRRRPSYDKAM